MKQDHNGHGIRHYACSDAWEPPEIDVQTSCTVHVSDEVAIRHPEVDGAEIKATEVYPLQFMR